nr:DUF397 domain-containing protein [Spirillospora albida]
MLWRKSSYSDGMGGECVELAALPGRVLVRDSKDSEGPVFALTLPEARRLLRSICEG